jgi:hypothetical protein
MLLVDTAYAGGADRAATEAAGVTGYAPLPQEKTSPTKHLPKSTFPWLPAEQTYAMAGPCRNLRSAFQRLVIEVLR